MYLLLAVGLVQTWLLDGLVVPYRVSGGSMAETLLGVHRKVTCADCGFGFSCDADVLSGCPAGRVPQLRLRGQRPGIVARRGRRTRADRPRRFLFRRHGDGRSSAFRQPQQAGEIVVKRVVGLPGESIEIRGGDVYVDGQIQRKNLAEQRALAVLVHDANFPPQREPKPPPRWRAETFRQPLESAGGRFTPRRRPRKRADRLARISPLAAADGRRRQHSANRP